MTAKLFEAAPAIVDPWFAASVEFDETDRTYRHLNFFQHECHLQVRTLRKTDKSLQGRRWTSLKDTAELKPEARIERFITSYDTNC